MRPPKFTTYYLLLLLIVLLHVVPDVDNTVEYSGHLSDGGFVSYSVHIGSGQEVILEVKNLVGTAVLNVNNPKDPGSSIGDLIVMYINESVTLRYSITASGLGGYAFSADSNSSFSYRLSVVGMRNDFFLVPGAATAFLVAAVLVEFATRVLPFGKSKFVACLRDEARSVSGKVLFLLLFFFNSLLSPTFSYSGFGYISGPIGTRGEIFSIEVFQEQIYPFFVETIVLVLVVSMVLHFQRMRRDEVYLLYPIPPIQQYLARVLVMVTTVLPLYLLLSVYAIYNGDFFGYDRLYFYVPPVVSALLVFLIAHLLLLLVWDLFPYRPIVSFAVPGFLFYLNATSFHWALDRFFLLPLEFLLGLFHRSLPDTPVILMPKLLFTLLMVMGLNILYRRTSRFRAN